MNKKGVIIGVIVVAIIAGITALSTSSQSETENLDKARTHGTISTPMGSQIVANTSAPITILEFGDYQCEQCYAWFHETKPSIVRDYIDTGKANLVFVDLAFLGRDSIPASMATYCSEDQGMYWEYHDLLYNSQESVDGGWANSERLKAFAFSLDLDMELFESCLDSGKYSKRVQYNIQQARENGVRGTPGFFIVGPDGQQKIGGAQPFSVFQKILDSMI